MKNHADNRILTGAIIPTFFSFVIPSLLALLALTTANLVDGIFIGNFVGTEALAAINFMIPYLALLFGIGLMLAIGGSVRAGKYLGEGNYLAASAIFSKCLLAITGFSILILLFNLFFYQWIFLLLGAPGSLHELMHEYFQVISLFLTAQLSSVVLYYFIRADGKPVLGTTALTCGAIINILLDALFIGYFNWGMAGAAWATGIAQVSQLGILASYFFSPSRKLEFKWIQKNWSEVAHSAFNGVSEFINEISGGLVILVINWLLMSRLGVDGVSAFTVINYMLFASLMMFYGIADALQLLVAQNYGARNVQRIRQFMVVAVGLVVTLSAIFLSALFLWRTPLIHSFVDNTANGVIDLAAEFILVMWPIFMVNGLNILLSSYLTAMHKPTASASIALLRSLIFPVVFMSIFFWWLPTQPLLAALPLAEACTFLLALILYWRFSPGRLISAGNSH